ncbi:MAG TPA: 4-alpha-glucanotransferase [Thermoanaerobaculia bacterium]|nr:4-alpha-glucanotransferase [Thermoanaerobaculia bacterium]
MNVVWERQRYKVDADWELQLESGETRDGRGEIGPLPYGYHKLRAFGQDTLLIAAPLRAYAPEGKSWGIFAPLYAMRTDRSWGAGDLGDMQSYRQWVTSLGGNIVATLPMLAIDTEGDPSPYSPLSRLFWNEMYLDIERVPEFDPSDRDAATIAALQNTDTVDYAGVMREKKRVLQKMLERFKPDTEYEEFANRARDYARFRGDERLYLYAQYRMEQQLREIDGLYLDFPLGVNPNGYDAERYAQSFARGVTVGAPPDLFFTKGQNWGFAPFDPDAIREQHYDYFRAAIAHHASHAGVLRIDHVMGLHRLFWIPQGGEPKDGVYVRYPEKELYAILCVESNRHRCSIVGEDLGTVPQYVPAMMKKHGLRRMYVVQYEASPSVAAGFSPPRETVASINTHDMPTFTGFWKARDVAERVEQGLLDDRGAREERQKRGGIRDALCRFLTARGLLPDDSGNVRSILEALLRFLAASSAEIVLVNLEDLWLETEPQNRPGLPERSWRQKFMLTLEQAQRDPEVMRALRKVNGNAT